MYNKWYPILIDGEIRMSTIMDLQNKDWNQTGHNKWRILLQEIIDRSGFYKHKTKCDKWIQSKLDPSKN